MFQLRPEDRLAVGLELRRLAHVARWEAAAENLSSLVRQGKWGDLPAQISDEMLDAFAIVCPPQGLGARLKARYQ